MRILFLFFSIFILVSCNHQSENIIYSKSDLKKVDSLLDLNSKTFITNYQINKNLDLSIRLLGDISDSIFDEYRYKVARNAVSNLNIDSKFYLNSFKKNAFTNKDSLSIGRYYLLLGRYKSKIEEVDSSYIYLIKAEKIFERLDSQNELIECDLFVARHLIDNSDFSAAEKYLIKAEISLKKSTNLNLFKLFYMTKTLIYNINYNYKLSENLLEKALKIGVNGIQFSGLNRVDLMGALVITYNAQAKYTESHNLMNKLIKLNSKGDILFPLIYDINNKINLIKNFNAKNEYERLIQLTTNNKEALLLLYFEYTNYLISINSFTKAKEFAIKTYNLSKKNNSPFKVLNSLLLLSKTDPSRSQSALIEYDKIIDQIIIKQRQQKNNFYKIQLETNEIFQAKKQLESQRNQILLAICILLLIYIIIFIIYRNRIIKSKYELNKKHQKSNEIIQELITQNQAIEVESRQKEQRRIAMEIHDNVLNQLASVRYRLFKLNFTQDPNALNDALYGIENIRQVEVELRNLTHNLTSQSQLEHISLKQMIEQLIVVHHEIYGQNVIFEMDTWDWEKLPAETKLCLVRMIQEALFNTAKHAKADNILIAFTQIDGRIKLSIKDDGKGFELHSIQRGIGLQNMETRAAQIQAKIEILTNRNQGTEIIVESL